MRVKNAKKLYKCLKKKFCFYEIHEFYKCCKQLDINLLLSAQTVPKVFPKKKKKTHTHSDKKCITFSCHR